MTETDDVLIFEVGGHRVAVATGFGPRLVGFGRSDGPDLLAHLGDDVFIDLSGSGCYTFRGGHRLWAAPEEASVTYAPDDSPCQVVDRSDWFTVTGRADAAGLVKRLKVTAGAGGVVVEHVLANAGRERRRVAPWAITQFPLDGVALLPLGAGAPSESFQADRRLVTWPYTSLTDGRISWRADGVTVFAAAGPRLKLGAGPAPGALGYLRHGWLFVKEIPDQVEAPYPDLGAVGQVFCCEWFCELESVGPLVDLDRGMSVSHVETWRALPCQDPDRAWEELR